jgi:hypothetical protein
LQKEKDEL